MFCYENRCRTIYYNTEYTIIPIEAIIIPIDNIIKIQKHLFSFPSIIVLFSLCMNVCIIPNICTQNVNKSMTENNKVLIKKPMFSLVIYPTLVSTTLFHNLAWLVLFVPIRHGLQNNCFIAIKFLRILANLDQ